MNLYLDQILPPVNDYAFHSMRNKDIKDALIIRNPCDAICKSPVLPRSVKTLDEHISFISDQRITDAIVVAQDISFLCQCFNLENLSILPDANVDILDYSPLYSLPNIKWLRCEIPTKNNKNMSLDFSRLKELEYLCITGWNAEKNISSARKLKTLYLNSGSCRGALSILQPVCTAENLVISDSLITSLSGISCTYRLKRLELSYNKKLHDISELASLKNTLLWLDIDNCNSITDFSVLSNLENLELLRLSGTQSLPSLDFISKMPKLKCLVLTMNVVDGNMDVCTNIPYVAIKNRKHFSHKDKEFSKSLPFSLSIESYE